MLFHCRKDPEISALSKRAYGVSGMIIQRCWHLSYRNSQHRLAVTGPSPHGLDNPTTVDLLASVSVIIAHLRANFLYLLLRY
jgi:hypothetical protein